jgi:hypothetical protein
MSVSVCEQAPARQAKSHSTGFRLSAFSLVTSTVIHGVPGHGVTWIAVVILILVLVVVAPAVWSREGYRRKAGRDVLDRLLP